MTTDQNHCPDCGSPITNGECGFTAEGIEWGCGWAEPVLFELAELPDPQ